MSLTYLQNNSFNYQDIPANAIVYRSVINEYISNAGGI